ncbi:MAG: DinB family protein [Acidobacteriota bacterium]
MSADTTQLFLSTARKSLLDEHWPRLRECVCSLTDEQVWWRPNPASNSIGNLLLHLNGNVGQWIVATFNRTEDTRNRPSEFSERGPAPVAGLLARLGSTVEEAGAVLSRLSDTDLLSTYEIQGYTVTGLYAVFHCVEHFASHYGQIAYITKELQNRDLGFFRNLDSTGRAK